MGLFNIFVFCFLICFIVFVIVCFSQIVVLTIRMLRHSFSTIRQKNKRWWREDSQNKEKERNSNEQRGDERRKKRKISKRNFSENQRTNTHTPTKISNGALTDNRGFLNRTDRRGG